MNTYRTTMTPEMESKLRAMSDEPGDAHAIPFTVGQDMPTCKMAVDHVKIELVEFGVTVYMHDPLDGSGAQLIVDIDNTSDDPQALKIYRNDALVYDELPKT